MFAAQDRKDFQKKNTKRNVLPLFLPHSGSYFRRDNMVSYFFFVPIRENKKECTGAVYMLCSFSFTPVKVSYGLQKIPEK